MNLGFTKGLPQQWAIFTCLIGGTLLCIAFFMEHVMGLAPCPLCMMQRLWIALVAVIAYASLLHNPRWGIYPLFGCIACIIGGGFSIRQLWLQSLPADQVPAWSLAGLSIPAWVLLGFITLFATNLLQLRSGSR